MRMRLTSPAGAGYGEACPREYVTGESLATAHAFVKAHETHWHEAINGVDALRSWVLSQESESCRMVRRWAGAA